MELPDISQQTRTHCLSYALHTCAPTHIITLKRNCGTRLFRTSESPRRYNNTQTNNMELSYWIPGAIHFVCMYVCMYVRQYVNLHGRMSVFICVSLFVRLNVCMYVCMYKYVDWVYVCDACMRVWMFLCIHICVYMYVYMMYVCVWMSVCACVGLCMCVCLRARVHACVRVSERISDRTWRD